MGTRTRIAAVVSALLVAAAGGTLRSTNQPAAAAGGPTGAASAYLVGKLVTGDHLTNSFGVDYGLTADLAISLAASDDQDPALAKVVGYLAAHVADYADPAGTGQYPGPYSGAVGKLALVAEATGQDPHNFGGFDLLKTLTDHVCTAADSAGSCTAAGDFYQAFSPISQAFGILALARAGVTPPAAAVTRLEQMQCTDGGFSSELPPATPCASDVDATGYALQALSQVTGTGTAVGNGRSYLLAGQQPDGGFIGASGENANSTALASQGLLVTGSGSQPEVTAAVNFLLGLQNADGGFGVSDSTPASDVRATTQALPAVAGATLTTVSDVVTPVAPVTPSSTPSARPTPTASSTHSNRPSPSATPAGSGAGVAGVASSQGQLAATGSHTRVPLLTAALLILAGAAALRLARRPRPDRRR
ncbi:MAG TPA: prenyltransferase/squalene oxidase repeat-containing protein [Jatrophihabitans sp.]|nr:prenyltransferase/squalene oxidase repeat-containing protein [Jatrophihabitans sp.]